MNGETWLLMSKFQTVGVLIKMNDKRCGLERFIDKLSKIVAAQYIFSRSPLT